MTIFKDLHFSNMIWMCFFPSISSNYDELIVNADFNNTFMYIFIYKYTYKENLKFLKNKPMWYFRATLIWTTLHHIKNQLGRFGPLWTSYCCKLVINCQKDLFLKISKYFNNTFTYTFINTMTNTDANNKKYSKIDYCVVWAKTRRSFSSDSPSVSADFLHCIFVFLYFLSFSPSLSLVVHLGSFSADWPHVNLTIAFNTTMDYLSVIADFPLSSVRKWPKITFQMNKSDILVGIVQNLAKKYHQRWR